MIDAFSSDAIPIHLLTREALALYVRKLSSQGVIVFHISNINLDLSPVMSNLAEDAKLAGRIEPFRPVTEEQEKNHVPPSSWVIMGHTPSDLSIVDSAPRWKPLEPTPSTRVWTDDYSNILSVLNNPFILLPKSWTTK